MSVRTRAVSFAAASAVVLGGASAAHAVAVPGTSDPWLAGMPGGSTASSGDTAPAEAPVLVPGVPLSAGEVLTFSATGGVYNAPVSASSLSTLDPDGGRGTAGPIDGAVTHSAGAENGIANLTAPINSLVGVFLSDAQPSLSRAPSGLSFPSAGSGPASLSPALQQPFFIGDGLTGTGSGSVQDFVIPAGATRLYLGTMDEYSWYNNVGAFDVTVSAVGAASTPTPTSTPTPPPTSPGPTSVPEPATAPLLAGVLAGAFLLRPRSFAA